MASLNKRGHEVVSSIPAEPNTNLGREPRLSITDRMRLFYNLERQREDEAIKDDFDMKEDMEDFGTEGLLDESSDVIKSSGYEIPADAPDGYSASASRKAAQQAAGSKTQTSGSKGDSVESSSGPEASA